jgi:hypothetical protein
MSTWHYPQVYWLPLPSKLLAKGETTDTQAAERASTSNGGLLHDLLLGSRGVGEGLPSLGRSGSSFAVVCGTGKKIKADKPFGSC